MAVAMRDDDDRVVVAAPEPLWDGGTKRFDGPRLLHAIVVRGWTVEEFAAAARPPMNPNTVRNAVHGKSCWATTARRIYETLDKRRPLEVG